MNKDKEKENKKRAVGKWEEQEEDLEKSQEEGQVDKEKEE